MLVKGKGHAPTVHTLLCVYVVCPSPGLCPQLPTHAPSSDGQELGGSRHPPQPQP